MPDLIGPDVSFYQDDPATPVGVDFVKMRAAGAGYVIIRAGQNLWVDPDLSYNWQRAKEAGLPRGSYWYYDSRVSPEEQAELWIETIGWDLGELPLWCDFEEKYNGPFKGWQNFKKFVQRVVQLAGHHEVGIYTNFYYWNEQVPVIEQGWFADFPLWIANYNAGDPLIPGAWSTWLFRQYTENGNGPLYGAESNRIDLNYFNGDLAEFNTRFKIFSLPPAPGEPNPKELLSHLYFDGALYRKMEISTWHGKAIYHLIRIETLKAEFFVSPQLSSRKYVPDFLGAFDLDIAINGDGFVAMPGQAPKIAGYAASEGKPYGTQGVEASIYIAKDNQFTENRPPSSLIWNAISYPNRLATNGQIVPINKALDDIRARTAWGYTKDQKTVWFVAVDGADYTVKAGLNFPEVAKILIDLGCDVALMEDGGGSTTMAIRENGIAKILNVPYGEDTVDRYPGYKLRRVANVLSVRMKTVSLPPPVDPPQGENMATYKLINPVKPRPTPAVSGGSDPDLPAGYEFQSNTEADGLPAGTRFVKDPAIDKWLILGFYGGKEFVRNISVDPVPPPAPVPVKTHEIKVFNDGKISLDGGDPF
jgi:lysozyme